MAEKKAGGAKKRPILKYVLHGAILIGLIYAAVKYIDGESFLAALGSFNFAYVPFILVLSAGYIFLKGWRFVPLMRQVSRVPAGVLVKGYVAGTAATLLPGGVAARAGLMDQVGVPVSKSSAPVAFTSILDQAAFLLGTLLAALWFESARKPLLIALGILAGIGLALLVPGIRNLGLRILDWAAAKVGIRRGWRDFFASVRQVATPRVLLLTLVITLIGLGLQLLILDLALRGFGQRVPYPALLLAYVLPAMVGRNSALPGGVGVTEAGMVGVLSSTAGIDPDLGTAVTAIFRISTVLFQALLGALVYFFFWRGEAEARDPVSDESQSK